MKVAVVVALMLACARESVAPAAVKLPAPAVGASGQRLVHSEASPYGTVVVVERGDYRYLRFGSADARDDQSMISISDPESVPMDYIRVATIGAAYTPEVERLLMVGLGGGTFTTLVHRLRPDVVIDVAKINPVVVRVAREYFGVETDERYRIHIADGRAFVDGAREPYDLILLDAYTGDGIPEHLRTSDWFAAVAHKLAPAGVLVVNVSAEETVEREVATRVRAHLPALACFRTLDRLNLIVVARRDPNMPAVETLVQEASDLNTVWNLPFDLREAARQLDPGCGQLFR